MKLPFWAARRKREYERELAEQRHVDAWADMLIDETVLHQLNEDIGYPDELPYYDVCPAVGDGHRHLGPDWPFYAGFAALVEGESEVT